MRFWQIYMERFSVGFTVGRYGTTIKKKERDELKEIVENIQAYTGMMVPMDVEIDIKESNNGGSVQFQKAIDAYNVYMARSVLVPDLLGFSAKPTGSYAPVGQAIDRGMRAARLRVSKV